MRKLNQYLLFPTPRYLNLLLLLLATSKTILGIGDVVQTIGLGMNDSTNIICQTKILTVAAIWAGYKSEEPSSFKCEEWDQPTSYFQDQCHFQENCSVTASVDGIFGPGYENTCSKFNAIDKWLILRFFCYDTLENSGIKMETTTIHSNAASIPTHGPGFPWYSEDFSMRLAESGGNVPHVERTVILKLSDDSVVTIRWNKTNFSIFGDDESEPCDSGEVTWNFSESTVCWDIVVTSFQFITEYIVFDVGSGRIIFKSDKAGCGIQERVTAYKMKYYDNAHGLTVNLTTISPSGKQYIYSTLI
ncbi:hypothetical protein ACHWQZ_G017901 [Mnemiopsis leidyi]